MVCKAGGGFGRESEVVLTDGWSSMNRFFIFSQTLYYSPLQAFLQISLPSLIQSNFQIAQQNFALQQELSYHLMRTTRKELSYYLMRTTRKELSYYLMGTTRKEPFYHLMITTRKITTF